MPLEDVGSYPSVMSEFELHWQDVNAELGGTPATDMKLEGGFTLAQFTALRDDVQAKISGLEGLENGRQIAADSRDQVKAAIKDRLAQFRAILRAVLSKSKYAASAPILPVLTAAESKFMAPFDDAADLWGRINADATLAGFTPPLVIAGYTLANFTTDIAAVRAAYISVLTAENSKRLGLRERDALLPTAREYMVQYRVLVEGLLGPNHPLTQTLPVLSGPPGSTPDPVTLSGAFNAATSQADFSWTASANSNLDHYEVRMSPGPTFDAATATVIANLPPGTTTFSTTDGLQDPGDVAAFKAYVVLTTGNEAGSNTVTITRP